MANERRLPLKIGTMTQWGRVAAVGWVGERYYWMIDRAGSISMMPATVVEIANG